MDFIKICTQLTGFFPSRSIGAFKKIYEWTWLLILLLYPALTLIGAISIKSFKLGDIIAAVQAPVFAFRLSFCVVFFCLRKQKYMQILDEKRELMKWMKILVFKCDESISHLQNTSKTYTALMFFYIPCFISVLSLFNLFFLPFLLVFFKKLPTADSSKDNTTSELQSSATTGMGTSIISTAMFLIASILELKRRCIDFLIFKMYLHIIQETAFLTDTLTSTFTERRAFFQKVNLSNWLKCKERLLR
jgi:hypothetical protein